MSKCVTDLDKKFAAWKNKSLSVWDLNQAIHEYHDDIARELYKSYTMSDPIFTVAFGVSRGVIKLEDVEESCKEDVEKLSAAMLRNQEMHSE